MSGVGKIFFLCFGKKVSYVHQGCIYLIKNIVKPEILLHIIKVLICNICWKQLCCLIFLLKLFQNLKKKTVE